MAKTRRSAAGKTDPADSLPEFIDAVGLTRSPEQDERAADDRHLVVFKLDGEEYGVPIQGVREILRVPSISRVPKAPPHVRGVINVRGQVMPVVEIRTLLGMDPLPITPSARVLVAEVGGRVTGLLVDAVTQVLRLPADALKGGEEASGQADYIEALAQWQDRLIILLDVPRALQLERA